VADRGMLTRYGGYRGNTRCGPKLALLPCSLILAYQGLEEENLDKKSPGPPGWGLMQQARPLFIERQEIVEKPFRNTLDRCNLSKIQGGGGGALLGR